MNVRTALACIDQNTNCNRSQKLLLSGEPAYDVKVLHAQDSFVIKAQVDRSRKKEVAVKRKEDKDYSFRDEVNSFFIPLLFLQFFLQASLRVGGGTTKKVQVLVQIPLLWSIIRHFIFTAVWCKGLSELSCAILKPFNILCNLWTKIIHLIKSGLQTDIVVELM